MAACARTERSQRALGGRGTFGTFPILSFADSFASSPLVQTLTLPRHIVLLNGPPGAGKAETTPAAKSALGIDYSLEMSALLRADPEAQAAMASGGLVSDARSCVALLHALVDPARSCRRGCIVDGFPRSPFQVCTCAAA